MPDTLLSKVVFPAPLAYYGDKFSGAYLQRNVFQGMQTAIGDTQAVRF